MILLVQPSILFAYLETVNLEPTVTLGSFSAGLLVGWFLFCTDPPICKSLQFSLLTFLKLLLAQCSGFTGFIWILPQIGTTQKWRFPTSAYSKHKEQKGRSNWITAVKNNSNLLYIIQTLLSLHLIRRDSTKNQPLPFSSMGITHLYSAQGILPTYTSKRSHSPFLVLSWNWWLQLVFFPEILRTCDDLYITICYVLQISCSDAHTSVWPVDISKSLSFYIW